MHESEKTGYQWHVIQFELILSDRDLEFELVQRLLRHDRKAWEEFVDSFQRLVVHRIRRTADECRFKLDESEVEDICAEVFSGLLSNEMSSLRRFQGKSKLGTWLSVIARRTCLRMLDRRPADRGIGTDSEYDLAFAEFSSAMEDPLSRMIREETRSEFECKLHDLRETDREILELFYNQEKSYREIGELMGISTNAVGPKLSRAQKRLRKILNQE